MGPPRPFPLQKRSTLFEARFTLSTLFPPFFHHPNTSSPFFGWDAPFYALMAPFTLTQTLIPCVPPLSPFLLCVGDVDTFSRFFGAPQPLIGGNRGGAAREPGRPR